MGAADSKKLVESCQLHRPRRWGNGLWSWVWLPWLHCFCGNLATPFPYPVCTCHICSSSCFSNTSLSRTYFLETILTRFNRSRSGLYVHIILVSLWFIMGSMRMALLLISIITMMYLLPQRDQVRNWPVWLENMVSCTMYVWVYTLCTFLQWRWEVSHVSNGATFALATLKRVGLSFLQARLIQPLTSAVTIVTENCQDLTPRCHKSDTLF